MIKSFVTRPATTIMFVLFFVILGFVSYFNLNVERFPRVNAPMVVVNVVYPGASPQEIETQVLKKIEDTVVEVSLIKKMQSKAFESFGFVLIEFKLEADVNVKSVEVKDKVEGILNDLPDAIEKPIVQKLDPFATSVVDMVLYSEKLNTTELYEYADKTYKGYLSKIKGVGEIEIFGGQERQIRIRLNPKLMQERFISISEVIRQLKTRNLTVPGGSIDQDQKTLAVRFEGEFKSIEEIKKFRLTTNEGGRFALSEIAEVYDGSEDPTTQSRFNGAAVVTLSVKKVSDGNDVEVAEGVKDVIAEYNPKLPDGIKAEVAVDRSHYVVNETKSTTSGILIGIILTVLVLLFFTGDWKITLISSLVVPSSIVSSLLLIDSFGFTINFITLLAIATSLGTLIANAIVIIEAVLKRLEQGLSSTEAAIQGTKDAVIPVIAAGGTNLVVFTPIAFMGGMVGQFMTQFGFTVVFATIFSLIASFSITPMLCGLLLKPRKPTDKKSFLVRISEKLIQWLLYEYKMIYDLMFRFKVTSLIFVTLLFMGAFTVAPYIGNEFIPPSDESRVEVNFSLPLGTRIEETEAVARHIETVFKPIKEVKSVLSILGKDGEQNGTVVANLLPVEERSRSDVQIIRQISGFLSKIPNIEVEIKRRESVGTAGADISINFYGEDYSKLVELTKKAEKLMKESGYFISLTSTHKTPNAEAKLSPDPQSMDKYGVSAAAISQALRASIYGDDSNVFKEKGEEYDVVVDLMDDYTSSLKSLEDIFVISNTGLIPVTELGEVKIEPSVPTILRRDRHRVVQLNGYLGKSTAGQVQGILTEKFSKLDLPDGYSFQFVGNAENQAESGREIGKAFLIAMILTYMILAAILNSFVHPFTIATSIITSFSGVFLILFFMDSSINIASMLAFVMLVGLAVNNAILIIEDVEAVLRDKPDTPIEEAFWQGIVNQFRAVLMTSIAIVFGTLPQIFSPNGGKASMGMVIVGGILASIFFTFFLTPQVYYFLEKFKRFMARLRNSRA